MGRKASPPKKPLPPPVLCCPRPPVAVLPVLAAVAGAPLAARCDAAWAERMRDSERQFSGWGAGRAFADVPLWVGSHADALSADGLGSRGIRAVVNVAAECGDADGVAYATPQEPVPAEAGAGAGGGVTVLRLELADHCDAPVAPSFVPCAEFVARALERGDGVLIHCRGGVSRAPTFAVACLMLLKGVGLDAALDAIRAVRPQANPNLGFTIALVEFEQRARAFGSVAAQARLANVGGDSMDPPLSTLLRRWDSGCDVAPSPAPVRRQDGGAGLPHAAHAPRAGRTAGRAVWEAAYGNRLLCFTGRGTERRGREAAGAEQGETAAARCAAAGMPDAGPEGALASPLLRASPVMPALGA